MSKPKFKFSVTAHYTIEVEASSEEEAQQIADEKLTTSVEMEEYDVECLTACESCGEDDLEDLQADGLGHFYCSECREEQAA